MIDRPDDTTVLDIDRPELRYIVHLSDGRVLWTDFEKGPAPKTLNGDSINPPNLRHYIARERGVVERVRPASHRDNRPLPGEQWRFGPDSQMSINMDLIATITDMDCG